MAAVRLFSLGMGVLLAVLAGTGAPDAALAQAQAQAQAQTKPAASAPTINTSPWPRSFTEGGTQIVLHQPQLDTWEGNTLRGRIAVAVKTGTKTGSDGKPHDTLAYGAMIFTARTETDKVNRQVTLTDAKMQSVSFPTDKANEARYADLLRKIIARKPGYLVTLDSLEAGLAISRASDAIASVSVKNDPPDVLFSFEPALLVLIDGDPALKPAGVAGVERVVNTRTLILKQEGRYFLCVAGHWLASANVNGPWKAAGAANGTLVQAKTAAETAKQVDVMDEPSEALKKLFDSGKLPAILVSSKPAELIQVDGEPQFVDVADTQLAYIDNTPSDVFVDKAHDNAWYVLISGRWFTAASSNGPWQYVDGSKLPPDFTKIGPDNPKSAVLASIPGTPEARESLIANSIPQTATVNRKEAKLQVDYDGAPQFKPIETTALSYAWNTAVPVIKVNETSYFAVQNGVWFTAGAATGPWAVATEVPASIYSIPPSSPLHYVTYVRVYGGSDDTVHVGYTPGYYGTIASNGVVVYGTGYECDPWVGTVWYGCPATYGFAVDFGYDPYVGWTFGFAWGWAWASAWYGPWWGPWGYWPGYWPGYWGGGIATANIYGRWGNHVVAGVGAAWANPWTGNYGQAARGRYYNEATGGRGAGYAARNTNIYTGTTSAVAGGIRYNPQTGRVVGGQGGAAYNPYTGNAAAGGSRTTINTETGRVNQASGGVARSDSGATAAGKFSSNGANGDISGAGYAHYNKETGEVSKGGVVNVNDQIYAGKDGNVYKYEKGEGWQQVGNEGKLDKASPGDSAGVDSDRLARDRGSDRAAQRSASGSTGFERSNYNRSYQGHMGGGRPAGGSGRFGGGRRR